MDHSSQFLQCILSSFRLTISLNFSRFYGCYRYYQFQVIHQYFLISVINFIHSVSLDFTIASSNEIFSSSYNQGLSVATFYINSVYFIFCETEMLNTGVLLVPLMILVVGGLAVMSSRTSKFCLCVSRRNPLNGRLIVLEPGNRSKYQRSWPSFDYIDLLYRRRDLYKDIRNHSYFKAKLY